MPLTSTAQSDTGLNLADTPHTGWHGQAADVWAQIDGIAHNRMTIYIAAGVLAGLLALSLIGRRKRAKAEEAGGKAALTRTDRAVTRVTGILATAVVALGAWKVFGDVLHLNPVFRAVLFFFAEAQIVAAWRRVRRHIHRHAQLGPGVRTIYAIALGSATVAAFDASNLVEVLLRFFAAAVAAYMIAEELAEELDIHLTANPLLRNGDTKPRMRGRIKWAVSLERTLVWLRLAEPTERTVAEVERQRRVSQFARTAYRLHLLKEQEARTWRIRVARWQLRRQTESGNEHLNLAADPAALADMRAQLALLYTAEDATSRRAVADLNPLRPAPRLAIAATAWRGENHAQPDSQNIPTETPGSEARSEPTGSHPASHTANQTENTDGNAAENPPAAAGEKPAAKTSPAAAKPTAKPDHPLADHPVESVRKLARAFARKPGLTNAELAKLAKVSPGTANRYGAEVRAAFTAQNESSQGSQEPTQPTLTTLPFAKPNGPVTAGVNGTHYNPEGN